MPSKVHVSFENILNSQKKLSVILHSYLFLASDNAVCRSLPMQDAQVYLPLLLQPSYSNCWRRQGVSKRALTPDEVCAPFCATGALHGSFLREKQKSEFDFVPLEILWIEISSAPLSKEQDQGQTLPSTTHTAQLFHVELCSKRRSNRVSSTRDNKTTLSVHFSTQVPQTTLIVEL